MSKRKWMLFLAMMLGTVLLCAQNMQLEQGMKQVDEKVRNIGSMACGLIGALIGLIALGRAAWKFANGEQGAVLALLEGILAIVLGQVAAGFFGK